MKQPIKNFLILLAATALVPLAAPAQGTAFTYQGRLNNNGAVANGAYDLQFAIFDAPAGGSPIGSALTANAVAVSNGLFTVTLDFGAGVFTGADRWLFLSVKTNGAVNFTPLTPPQKITATPYAVTAGSLNGALPATQLSGVLPSAQLAGTYSSLVTLNNGANTFDGTFYGNFLGLNFLGGSFSGQFIGDGGSLINLNAAQLTGTVPAARLSPNVAWLNQNQTFSAANSFTNATNNFVGGFTGNGLGLTNLNAASLTGGALPSGQLAGNYANAVTLNNSQNSFSGAFSGDGAGLTNLVLASLGGLHATDFWQTGGNAGTGAANFLGTTDGQSLELRVNSTRALRLEPTAGTPNVIGGFNGNFASNGVVGAMIGGGGQSGNANTIGGNYSSISGGANNTASGPYATIGGGSGNQATKDRATVAGGYYNQANGQYATVSGGVFNYVSGDRAVAGGSYNNALAFAATVGGGNYSTANGYGSTVGGGENNTATGGTTFGAGHATVAGGYANSATNSFATVAGGSQNMAGGNGSVVSGGANNTASGLSATIGGGNNNQATTDRSTVAGGYYNQASGQYATVSGGVFNYVSGDRAVAGGSYNNALAFAATVGGGNLGTANGYGSTVGGGENNTATGGTTFGTGHATVAGGYANSATNSFATVAGGAQNIAGGQYSFATGRRAQALHDGAFVWADSTAADFSSTTNDQFNVRASGGVRIATTTAGTVGAQLAAGATAWSVLSDRNAKKNFAAVDTVAVLAKLAAMPVQQWNYKWEADNGTPNIGPTAQAFKAAFYPGRDDKSISTLEFDGVELAAIQGLNQKLEERDAHIKELEQRLEKLERLMNHKNGGAK